jgi:hypothetical protein
MATQNTDKSQTTPSTDSPRALYLALDVAERGQATAISVLQDARTELRTAVDGGLELAEKLASGTLRFARKLVQKVDDASADALKGAERALTETIETARVTARAGKQLADKAVERVTRQSSAA